MVNPFDTQDAYRECLSIAGALDDGFMELKRSTPASSERDNQGLMIGCLICKDRSGNTVKLKSVSGVSYTLSPIDGISDPESIYVEPVVSPKLIEEALSKNDREIHLLTSYINNQKSLGKKDVEAIKKRNTLCNESLDKVYSLYSFYCADGCRRSLKEIMQITNKGQLPPTGTGECCEIKMLNYAFAHSLNPVSMAEIFYTKGCSDHNPPLISPCDDRCALLLPIMLGLRIIYRDSDIIIVNKQSGLLSVPGRGIEKSDCIESRVKRLFPDTIKQPAVHRLDMETSGLLILAFNKEAHRNLNMQFMNGQVQKKYIAVLDGVLAKEGIKKEGILELYFRLDIDNRPHQIWDDVYGKKSITQWKILDVERYESPDGTIRHATRVLFIPHTGRTHQLRLASADNHGFGVPIIGDSLYGKCMEKERLLLHSSYIRFTHPVTGKVMEFNCPPDF